MNNVVVVKHLEDYTGKRYHFRVPSCIHLNKGETVILATKKGEKIGVCLTDSEIVTDNMMSMLNDGREITGWVVGIRVINNFYFGQTDFREV